MRDVRDVHAEEIVPVRKLLHFDGVVEVLRGLAVDRDDVVLAQVDALCDLLGCDLIGDGIRRREHLRRELVRDLELADDQLDVDARLADETENFDDAAAGDVAGAVGVAVDLDVDHLLVARVHRAVAVDDDVVVEPRVERRHERLVGIGVKAADDGAVRAAQHRRHFADDELALPDGVELRAVLVDANDDEIAVHRALHGAAVDEDVGLLAAAAEHGAVAVGVHANAAGVIRRELEERVALAADGDDDAVLFELFDGALDLLTRGVGALQTLPDFLDREQTAAAPAKKIGD